MLYAHASFRQRSSGMSCQSPKRCHFQNLMRPSSGTVPLVKGYKALSHPGTKRKRGGRPNFRVSLSSISPSPNTKLEAWSEIKRKTIGRAHKDVSKLATPIHEQMHSIRHDKIFLVRQFPMQKKSSSLSYHRSGKPSLCKHCAQR